MKFNQSLKFNIVPEWSELYVNYDNLKKLIYSLQQKQLDLGIDFKTNYQTIEDVISQDLNSVTSKEDEEHRVNFKNDLEDISSALRKKTKEFNPLREFFHELVEELIKVNGGFEELNKDISSELSKLATELNHYDSEMFGSDEKSLTRTTTTLTVEEEVDSSDDEEYHHTTLINPINFKNQRLIGLKQQTKSIYIKLNELKSFIELNKLGFIKIVKKFDKNLNYQIKAEFEDFMAPIDIFRLGTIRNIDGEILRFEHAYCLLSTRLDSSKTKEAVLFELKSYLKDHIIWERNTVWKDLLSLELKKQDFSVNSNFLHMSYRPVKLGKYNFKLPKFFFSNQIIKILVAIVAFVVLLTVKTLNDRAEGRCLAVLVACAILWATEALPLYATAMLVPLLVVSCRIIKNDDGSVMESADAASYVLAKMWSSTIMILIGGFTLAAALSKYNIAKIVSSWILSWVGTKPRNILLTLMMIALFLSMWISNVATPILCYSLIQPVLKTIPTSSPFAKALILGIALACNMAGMSSPISSPQNVVALESMDPNPGWGNWFAVALPVSIIGTLGIWLEMIFTFKIESVTIKPFKPIKDRLTIKQIFIVLVTIVTIVLWCVMTKIKPTFGQSGIISVIPFVLFFGTGLLKTDDLNNFPWSIVLLAMGGLALGAGVSSSGLLSTVAVSLQAKIEDFNVWIILIIFGILVLVIATFVSHTVAAIIIIPLVKEVGESLPTNHANLLVMGTALLASAAMGLPTSGFPNVTAISMTDELGNRYLTVGTFINRGVPASVIAYVVAITVGYGIMTALKF